MEDKELLNKLTVWVDAHEEEMLTDAMTLIAINSEKMEAKPGKPFGEGTAQVFEAAQAILERDGFAVKNYDNYVLAADLNTEPSRLDILAHLDVVPAGEGFTVTEPFAPVVKDGKLYGRGSADDKGPAVAALYAMRAVRELGLPLTGNCRLILGADEECGSSDIRYYYAREKEAPMTFSPDADFPLINIEKGGMHLTFTVPAETEGSADFGKNTNEEAEHALLQIQGMRQIDDMHQIHGVRREGVRLVSVQAGTKINVVPGKARAVIAGLRAEELEMLAESVTEATGVHFTVTGGPEALAILAEGTPAHAASPETGNNALTGLIALLARIPFADAQTHNVFEQLALLFPHGDVNGRALGVNHEDAESGRLTLSLDLLSCENGVVSGSFDCRAPLCATEENTAAVIRSRLQAAGFATQDRGMFAPHCVPADSPFVRTLLQCYEDVTGREGRALAIGGGTYVHHLQNGVAFGCSEPEVDNHMHAADEFMVVEQMKKSAVIFAAAILRLCR